MGQGLLRRRLGVEVSQGEGGDPVVVVDDGEGLGEKGGKS